ncbi:MAG TPA: hypothetical protein PKY87_12605 [Terricaulis sp.]|nr:hypothetical protein [Terricaulis sp.]
MKHVAIAAQETVEHNGRHHAKRGVDRGEHCERPFRLQLGKMIAGTQRGGENVKAGAIGDAHNRQSSHISINPLSHRQLVSVPRLHIHIIEAAQNRARLPARAALEARKPRFSLAENSNNLVCPSFFCSACSLKQR